MAAAAVEREILVQVAQVGQVAAVLVHQVLLQALQARQTQVAAAAAVHIMPKRRVLAVAELFMSGLRFNYERTIFCTIR